ncbi:TrmB family transcriptional regulator [Thermococcus sp.]
MREKELRALMKDLGLNEYEVRAYLTLIKRGALTAGELATLSKVPQPRIYDVIRTLMSKGFVTTSGSRPKKVIPVEPARVLDAMKERYEQKISLVREELEKLYTPIEETETVLVVKSKITLEDYIKKAIQNVKLHLSIAAPLPIIEKFEEELRKKQKAEIHIFAYGKGDVPKVGRTVKIREVGDPLIVIQDRELGIYAPYDALTTSGSSLYGYALIIEDQNLLFMFDRYFYHVLWPTGKTIYHEERKLELPREYLRIRELVEDIKNFNLVGYKVEVFGKFVKTRKTAHITGRIAGFFESEGKVISNITIETFNGKRYVVGGWNSSLEDIEAERIILKGR